MVILLRLNGARSAGYPNDFRPVSFDDHSRRTIITLWWLFNPALYAAYVSDEGKISVHLRQDRLVTTVPRVDICFDSLEGDLFVRPKSSRSVSVNMAPSKIVPMDLESTGGEV
jgi:hypothetical protein